MSYKSETIAMAINRLNQQYFLPAIQREFVWKPEQICQLFDSIMRGYPISSFLFWELKSDNRDRWQAYRFIDRARDGGTHNVLANTNGVQQVNLVLDGQQRLTSLLVGLKGTYVVKKKYMRYDNPSAWTDHRLYLDLLKDPYSEETETDTEVGLYYGFAFLEKLPLPELTSHWFEVGKILDFESEKEFEEFRDKLEDDLPEQTTRRQTTLIRKNLERLHRVLWKEDVIAYYTEVEQDYDRVLDIFVRANEGGTKLSKSDLLLSMVTSKWGGVNAREEIYGFVDRLNDDLTRKNNFDKDFIMKSCLVLTDLLVTYKVQNFSNENLNLIQKNWGRIKSAIERGVDLVNSFGIDRDNLTSANALIPIIYYLYQRHSITLRGTTPFDVRNAAAIRKWLAMALLNGVFGGSSDTMLRDIRAVLQQHPSPQADFPLEPVNAVIRKAGRSAELDDFTMDSILAMTYGRQLTFLALSMLYDDANWGTMTFHQDHIFPRSAFRWRDLDAQGNASWFERKDRLGNLTLLLGHENIGKSDHDFDEWLATRDPSFLKRHLIPEDPSLWKFDRFDSFLAAREDLIKERLKQVFAAGPPPN